LKENQTTISGRQKLNQPGYFIKRIGNTTYRVGVHFSGTNTETARDKIMRLVKTEAQGKGAVNQ